ncbi:MAG: aminotransferase class I/II-fold pyridoxal phosphate-dependent enzyme [Armatimonadetes bacterium]|nr:aminotransferase class I/II-fold pyridoxal phosphate-dependent enzyme [Armatimonadota bacterium]
MSGPPRLSKMVQNLPPSGIREFFDLVIGMDDVISLGVGEPDFVTPWHICDAAIAAMRRGMTSYTSNLGLMELREAIAADMQRRWGVAYRPETQIIVTVGVSEGLDLVMRALLDPGDEVIVPEPCFVAYRAAVLMAGGIPVTIATREADEFRLLPDDLEAAITPRTRALLIGYPNNPTGATMSREDLLAIAKVCSEHDVLVLSDEIYALLTYEGQHTCFASLPDMYERTLVFNGFSKAYAMTGWRLGYACGPEYLIDALNRLHAYTVMCAPVSAQVAATEALRHGDGDMQRMVAEYDQRRRLFVKGLNDIGLPCFMPRGAFYAFPRVGHLGLTSKEFSRRLLFEQKVAAVPGTAFGACGEGHLRCTYATGMQQLKEALDRMGRFVDTLRQEGASAAS